jgi:hypothetical protein
MDVRYWLYRPFFGLSSSEEVVRGGLTLFPAYNLVLCVLGAAFMLAACLVLYVY